MTRTQKTAILWFVGGAALLVSAMLTTPTRMLGFVAGLLFFVVGIATLARGS